jgi:hypothetical protein
MRRLLILTAAAVLSLALAAPAMADTVHVDDHGDAADSNGGDAVCDTNGATGGFGTPCTLRAAVTTANDFGDQTDIVFDTPGQISIASPLNILHHTTITGQGSGLAGTIVDGGDTTGLFITNPTAAVDFKDIRLQNGALTPTGGISGAALNLSNATTLDNVTVTSNQITGAGNAFGGAISTIDSGVPVTLTNSTVSDNTIATTGAGSADQGAGIYTGGPLFLTDSTVSGNTITAGDSRAGAGVFAGGQLAIEGSAITANSITGTGDGGGIFTEGLTPGPKTITNSTISGNTAPGGSEGGGGLRISKAASITSTTFANNSSGFAAGSDVSMQGAEVLTFRNTILASGGSACTSNVGPGHIVSANPGNNIDVGTSCGFGTTNGNQQNTSPLLAALALNAPGTTAIHALMPNSPAIDAAEAGCSAGLIADQRGIVRPQGTACDVGSFELEQWALTVTLAGAGTGSVSSSPAGIACPSDCSDSVPQGLAVTLTATPSSGSTFTGWTSCDSPSGNQCTQTVGADETVTATYAVSPPPPASTTPPASTPPTTTSIKKCKKKKRRAAAAKKCKKRK